MHTSDRHNLIRHPAFSLRLMVEAMPPVIPLDGRKRSSVDTPTRIKKVPSERRRRSLWRRYTFDPSGGVHGTTFSAIKGYHWGHGFGHQPRAKCRMSNAFSPAQSAHMSVQYAHGHVIDRLNQWIASRIGSFPDSEYFRGRIKIWTFLRFALMSRKWYGSTN